MNGVSEQDNRQDQRLSALETGQSALGRSVDQIRKAHADHEEECKENWKGQRIHNTKVESHIRFQRWLGGAILTGLAGIGALLIEHFLGTL